MKFYTTDEVAEILSVNAETVRRWIRSGQLEAFDTGKGYRIDQNILKSFINERS